MQVKIYVTLLLSLLLTGCGGWQRQSNEIGDNSEATVNQQQDAAQGAKVQAGDVEEIVTNNTDGIPIYWFLLGTFVLGAIIPQPKWMKIIW